MHFDRARPGFAVEAAYIARRIMKAHEPVHGADCRECCLHGRMHLGSWRVRDRDFHECAEQRLRPGASYLRREAMDMILFTPSVT